MARIFGKGQVTCLKRVNEYTMYEYPGQLKKQQTNVIVGARLATVCCLTVGRLSVRDDFDPLDNES